MLNKEEKQNVAKIKKLIRTRDFEKIEMGIELVRSINNPKIYDELLGNVEYILLINGLDPLSMTGKGQVQMNIIFKQQF